jgi:hypothetical protein
MSYSYTYVHKCPTGNFTDSNVALNSLTSDLGLSQTTITNVIIPLEQKYFTSSPSYVWDNTAKTLTIVQTFANSQQCQSWYNDMTSAGLQPNSLQKTTATWEFISINKG